MMADFKKAFKKLMKLEFSSPKNALHKNKGESDVTFMGIYRAAHPDLKLWGWIDNLMFIYGDIEAASEAAYNMEAVVDEVKKFYKEKFWDEAKLDSVKSQKIAEEIFIFGVNVGMKNAVRAAQKVVGVEADGIVGPKTLKALNEFDENLFDIVFDAKEAEYYAKLVEKRPSFKIFLKGWLNRAKIV